MRLLWHGLRATQPPLLGIMPGSGRDRVTDGSCERQETASGPACLFLSPGNLPRGAVGAAAYVSAVVAHCTLGFRTISRVRAFKNKRWENQRAARVLGMRGGDYRFESAIALPPDPELRADLCAPTWKLGARGILLESKDGSSGFGNLRQRLGRSPGKGDAVVMAWSEGNAAAASRHNAWKWEKYRERRQAWIV
jgi:hypothetical protein